LPPGSVIHIGKERDEKIKISIVDYDHQKCEERETSNVEECSIFKKKEVVINGRDNN